MESPWSIKLLGDFNVYAKVLEILESAKLATENIDTLGDIEEKIKDTKSLQSQVALELLIEKNIIN